MSKHEYNEIAIAIKNLESLLFEHENGTQNDRGTVSIVLNTLSDLQLLLQ